MSGGASACRTAKRLGEAAGLRVGDSAPISEEPSGNWRKEPKLSGGGRKVPKGTPSAFCSRSAGRSALSGRALFYCSRLRPLTLTPSGLTFCS